MNFLYDTAIATYALAAKVAAGSSPKIKLMLQGQRESLQQLEQCRRKVSPDGFHYWFHAASLGEFEQARPLIERLRREHPGCSILLTFFSPSGYEVRKNYDKVDCVAYLPFDRPALVRRFLDAALPHCAVFVKYEFWGNFLSELHSRGVPVFLIDAIFRPSQIFFRPWGCTFRKMLRCYTHIFVQDAPSRSLLASIGITNVSVVGDTRFDRVTDIMSSTVSLPLIEQWLEHSTFTFIAGSSWEPDEQRYLPWLNTYLASHPGARAIIAPHEFNDARLAELRAAIHVPSALYSEMKSAGTAMCAENHAMPQVLIIDCFGILSSLYRFGSVALVGGGFGTGIHNINEAAVYGLPVIIGPNHSKFKEAADLLSLGGAFEYTDAASFSSIISSFLPSESGEPSDSLLKASRAAARYIRDSLGATDKIYPSLIRALN